MDVALVDACFVRLLADDNGARAALHACHAAGVQAGSAAQQWVAASGLLMGIAADFADFRDLAVATSHFAQGCASAAAIERPCDRLRIAGAWLALPSLGHGVGHGDPPVSAARDEVFAALRQRIGAATDEDLLLAKLLVDHAALQNDAKAVERVAAIVQALLQPGSPSAASPAWQGRWWLVVAQNADYFGQPAAARAAWARAQQLADQHALPRLRFELLCDELQRALRAEDSAHGERVYAQLEQLRADVLPGRLRNGLRAQAAWHIWRGEYRQALSRIDLLLAVCEDVQVPARDRGSYAVQRAYALTGLGEHEAAIAELHGLRPLQLAGQGDVLEALIAMACSVQALDAGLPTARALMADALRRSQALGFNRFLLPLPLWAARVAEVGLDDGVATEFITAAVRARRLRPPDPTREHWPWRLQVQAFGELQLRRDGEALRFFGKLPKKPLELLALLVAHGAKPLPLAVAQQALWPLPEAGDAKASLEAALSRLRKLLDVPDAVQLADGGLRLDPRVVWTDVAAFETLAQRWLALHTQQAEPVAAAGVAQRALALYRGALLGSEPLSAPGRLLREQLARRHAGLVIGHGRDLEARGLWSAAAEVYEQGIARDLLAEPVYRALMRVQLQLGERAEVLRTFARCRDLLASVLGVAPTQETCALREAAAGRSLGL